MQQQQLRTVVNLWHESLAGAQQGSQITLTSGELRHCMILPFFFDKGKQLILSKWTNHKSGFPGKSSLSSREQDRQGDDTKTFCLFHFPFLWGILEVLVKLYCNGVMIQVSTWCFSTALLCPPVSALWAEPWFFTCAAHLISIDGNQRGCA